MQPLKISQFSSLSNTLNRTQAASVFCGPHHQEGLKVWNISSVWSAHKWIFEICPSKFWKNVHKYVGKS